MFRLPIVINTLSDRRNNGLSALATHLTWIREIQEDCYVIIESCVCPVVFIDNVCLVYSMPILVQGLFVQYTQLCFSQDSPCGPKQRPTQRKTLLNSGILYPCPCIRKLFDRRSDYRYTRSYKYMYVNVKCI